MSEALRREFRNYLAKQDEFVAKYDGRVIALKDGVVLGEYETELDAATETEQRYKFGTFLIQRVSAGDKDTSVKMFANGVTP